MPRKTDLAVFLLGAALGATAYAYDGSAAAPAPVQAPAAQGPAMHRLQISAQRLRDAIRLMSEKPAGPDRDAAIARAQAALARTQEAMAVVPPTRAPAPTSASAAGYDTSVRALQAASDALYASIHAMAAQPDGPGRDQAIRDANRALLQTQVAMANAYDATAFPHDTRAMGAGAASSPGERTITVVTGSARCRWLGTMWGCR